MQYYAKEKNMWPTESSLFNSIEDAIKWAEKNLKGQWAVYEKGLLLDKEVYSS